MATYQHILISLKLHPLFCIAYTGCQYPLIIHVLLPLTLSYFLSVSPSGFSLKNQSIVYNELSRWQAMAL